MDSHALPITNCLRDVSISRLGEIKQASKRPCDIEGHHQKSSCWLVCLFSNCSCLSLSEFALFLKLSLCKCHGVRYNGVNSRQAKHAVVVFHLPENKKKGCKGWLSSSFDCDFLYCKETQALRQRRYCDNSFSAVKKCHCLWWIVLARHQEMSLSKHYFRWYNVFWLIL
jgi:hypothetical protein